MYTIQPKKLLIINILDILRKYTDENHRLSQKEIVEILNSKYNMEVNRKTVKRNLIVNIIKSHINVIMGMIILKKSIQSAMEH